MAEKIEQFAAVVDAAGAVINVIVVPPDDAELGPAWQGEAAPKLHRLSAEDRAAGVGVGFRRHAGRFVDERPDRPLTPAQAQAAHDKREAARATPPVAAGNSGTT